MWEFQTDVAATGQGVLHDSCGSVWSSGTVLPDLGLVVFDTADCNFSGTRRYADSVLALRIRNGTLAWKFHPLNHGPACDDDFGATANAGVSPSGVTTFLGEGSKNGTYYSLDPRDGTAALVHQRGLRRLLGRFHRHDRLRRPPRLRRHGDRRLPPDQARASGPCATPPIRGTPRRRTRPTTPSTPRTAPGVAGERRRLLLGDDGGRGDDLQRRSRSSQVLDVRDAATGSLLEQVPLPQFNWSGIATVGDALVFGLGTTADATNSGIEVLTPDGAPPVVPRSR